MAKPTLIEWADDTVNPTSGCQGCELWTPGRGGPCYAGNFHETRLARSLPQLYAPTFDQVRLIPGRMAKAARCMDLTGHPRPDKPWLDGLRRKIFVGDLADIFSRDVPYEYLRDEIFGVAAGAAGSRHDWLLLTKQPQRVRAFATTLPEWPVNVWVGTSVTGPASLSRVANLRQIPAPVRYLSLEPLLADPGLEPWDLKGVDWVIVGGESDQGGHPARPFDPEWARRAIRLCRDTGTAVFVKQLGSRPLGLTLGDKHGGDWSEWPEELRVRAVPGQPVVAEVGTPGP